MKKYFFYEALLPVVLIVVVLVLGFFPPLSGRPHLFLTLFATGDLLPICILILVNAYVRLEQAEHKKTDVDTSTWRGCYFIFGLVILIVYLGIKMDVICNGEEGALPRMNGYAGLDIAFFLAVVLIGSYSVFRGEAKE